MLLRNVNIFEVTEYQYNIYTYLSEFLMLKFRWNVYGLEYHHKQKEVL